MSAQIPEKTKAVVVHGPEGYRIEGREVPRPGPGEMRMRVGHPWAVSPGTTVLRELGRFVEHSVCEDAVTVDRTIVSDDEELDDLGAHLGPRCWPAATRMLEDGTLPMDDICVDQYPPARLPEARDTAADSSGASVTVPILTGS